MHTFHKLCSRNAYTFRCFRLAFFCTLLFLNAHVFAQEPSAIGYVISLASPEQHLVEVQLILPAGAPQHELQLPVWNALYQVRSFAQYINWIHAKDRAGQAIPLHQMNASCWRVSGTENGAIVEYQIYADLPGPFGAQLNAQHAFFNLAEILIYPVDGRNAAMHVSFSHVPGGWRIATPLKSLPQGGFSADNYDRLVDSPFELGTFQESDFDESGGHFRVIVDADPADYDMQKITADLHKIVAAAISWMNDRPFDAYMFFYHFPHSAGGGGMEHAYSTAIELNAGIIKQSYYPLDTVSAHEFFHLWNVKRIRPQTLEPVDYTRENYTRALWFSEGVTSTVENTLELRGGLLDETGYFNVLGAEITELEQRPAHLTQSVEDSSLDAWLEGNPYYRRAERSVSYYNKGALLGVALDLAVRQASHDHASLREVLEWMNLHYAKQGRFFPDSEGVREAAEAVSHADLGWFFTKYVAGTEEIPWDDFLRAVGLHVASVTDNVPDPGFTASRNFDGPLVVADVTAGGEAERAGLQVGDTILELQGKPAGQDARQTLFSLNRGDELTIKVRGRRGERELKWQVGSRQQLAYELKDLDKVTPEQRACRIAWLKGEAETSAQNAAGTVPTTGTTVK
jgi:predicted metalloprotease with PDZ domain